MFITLVVRAIKRRFRQGISFASEVSSEQQGLGVDNDNNLEITNEQEG